MRTAAGRDFQARVMGDTASTGTGIYAPAVYMALTEDAVAPADGDTALASELSNVGGGLNRAQCAYAHTAGSTTYSLTKTFTMNANDGSTRTIRKVGILNAASGGTLVFEDLISVPPVMIPGDTLTVTDTVSMA